MLLILLTVFTFGILVEAGFYLMLSLPKKSLQDNKDQKVTETSEKKSNSTKIAELIDNNIAYDESLYLRNVLSMHFEKKLFSGMEISTQLTGTVESVNTEGGFLDPKTPYQIAIFVKVPNSEKSIPVFYAKEDLKNVTVNRKSPEKSGNNIEITALKQGDTVSVNETYDLVNFRLVKGEISILN